MRAITQYLKGRGFDCIPDDIYTRVTLWGKWYGGHVPSFHNYKQYNGKQHLRRRRKTLGMAKVVSEDWANLALNEKVSIVLEDEDATKKLWAILDSNHFRVFGNQLVEKTFAMGTGAFVERMDGDEVKIDYITAGMIYPLSWDNGKVTECAFASERASGKTNKVYLNIHRLEGRSYVIENHLFNREGQHLTEIQLPDGVKEEYRTGSDIPWFQILTPNIANNLDTSSPMGISVFANALDQLEGCDLIYDSYCNEFRLGKKRITVPISLTRLEMEEGGVANPVFDDNDTEFYAIPELGETGNKIEEHNMELRHEAHEAAIQTFLNLLSFKCGMGKDRYNFKDGQVRTATEVISEKSELYQSLKKHELLLESTLVGLVRAVLSMSGFSSDQEVTVSFDDSIIEDSSSQRETDRQDVRDGLLAKWEYRTLWRGEDEETAKAAVSAMDGDEPLGFGG